MIEENIYINIKIKYFSYSTNTIICYTIYPKSAP